VEGWLQRIDPVWVSIALFVVALVVYFSSNPGRSDFYDHFVWQADAFLQGRAEIEHPVSTGPHQNSHLQDVLPVGPDRAQVPFPPLPAIVLMPFPDRHIDHRVIFDAAMVVTRPVGVGAEIGLVAAYETLSETHWNAPHMEPNFTPNWVVDITGTIERKLEALACYQSQIMAFPGPRSVEAVRALAVFRGTQAGFACGEGLQIIRMTAPIERLWQGLVADQS